MFIQSDTLEDACSTLDARAGGYAVSCGADGARVKQGGALIHAPGFPVTAVDTNGAGDAFAGAYLAAVTNGRGPEQAARLATYVSSRVVSKYGPRFEEKLGAADLARIVKM